MCQLSSLSKLFSVWGVNRAAGIRTLNPEIKYFSVKALLKDSDCDGLPDTLEAKLLEKFRPYYKFSSSGGHDEENRPIDVVQYLKSCQVFLNMFDQDLNLILRLSNDQIQDIDAIENIPRFDVVNSPGIDTTIFGPTDIMANPLRTINCLTVLENSRDQTWAGASWDQIIGGNVGLYGHVVPVYLEGDVNNAYYKIEYWQFCAYNNANEEGYADHEGDWMTVQLIYDPRSSHLNTEKVSGNSFQDNENLIPARNIYSVLHYHHGDKTEFIMDKAAASSFIIDDKDGSTYLGFGKPDTEVMFFQDPDTKAWCHPVVYIEFGSHEFWPLKTDSKSGAPNHDGESFSFLTATPPNLGEVENPVITDEAKAARVMLRYNGYWGYVNNLNGCPPGPILHNAWSWLPNINDPHDKNYRGNTTRIRIPNSSLE